MPNREALSRGFDWRDMFRRYMATVVENEGIIFLYRENWSEAEWAAIEELRAERLRLYLSGDGD